MGGYEQRLGGISVGLGACEKYIEMNPYLVRMTWDHPVSKYLGIMHDLEPVESKSLLEGGCSDQRFPWLLTSSSRKNARFPSFVDFLNIFMLVLPQISLYNVIMDP